MESVGATRSAISNARRISARAADHLAELPLGRQPPPQRIIFFFQRRQLQQIRHPLPQLLQFESLHQVIRRAKLQRFHRGLRRVQRRNHQHRQLRFPARASTAETTAHPRPAAPRPAAPGPAAHAATPRAPPPPNPPPRSDISLPAPAAVRIAPPARHPQSNRLHSFPYFLTCISFFSSFIGSVTSNRVPLPSSHRALPIQLPAKFRNSPRHNCQTQSRALRFRRKKWLQISFLAAPPECPARRLPPRIRHPSPFACRSHLHVPAARSCFQRIHHQVRQDRRCTASALAANFDVHPPASSTSSTTPRRSASCRKTPPTSSANSSSVATRRDDFLPEPLAG